jgi:hypothetical protein
MADYRVDRSLLESYSTEEIQRILREEYDDYTPEAIHVFRAILEERGAQDGPSAAASPAPQQRSEAPAMTIRGDMTVNSAQDAVRVLNGLLEGVLNGSVDPQVAHVATGIVMGILRAREQEFMTEPEEDA